MPKKFTGANRKAVVAREKKQQLKEEQKKENVKVAEDRLWKDDDKFKQRKEEKKQMEIKKREEMKQRKLEAQAQLEKELGSIKVKRIKQQNNKLTQSEIRIKAEEPKNKDLKDIHSAIPLEENINRLQIENEIARTVDEAISVLSGKEQVDNHPEKRMKAAYKNFEERRLRELKTSNPTLKLSQLKQIVFKEWKVSSENPLLRK